MSTEIIRADQVPLSRSPVSQGMRGGGFVFVGGQMPRDPKSGRIVNGAEAQAELSLRHALEVLAAAGSSPEKVTLAFVYMTDLAAKPAVDKVFAEHFGDRPPARNLVEVTAIGEDAIVEISLIALA